MLLINIFLAFSWGALTGDFSPLSLAFGFAIGYAFMWMVQGVAGCSSYVRKVPQVIDFSLFFVWELILANLRVASALLFNQPPLRPGVIAVPLDVHTDTEITLLANLITLTPGTLSLDVSDDKSILYVHCTHIEDVETARQDIKQGFERRVRELFA